MEESDQQSIVNQSARSGNQMCLHSLINMVNGGDWWWMSSWAEKLNQPIVNKSAQIGSAVHIRREISFLCFSGFISIYRNI